jgi:hypothetical protein
MNGVLSTLSALMQQDELRILLDTDSLGRLYGHRDGHLGALTELFQNPLNGRAFQVRRTVAVGDPEYLSLIPEADRSYRHDLIILDGPAICQGDFASLAIEEPSPTNHALRADEALLFIDLFLKHKGYHVVGSRSFIKWDWYYYWVRSQVPHFRIGDILERRYIEPLLVRLMYGRMACDQVGIQHYIGGRNDAVTNSRYHFNYLTSLLVGAFDCLALAVNKIFNLGLPEVNCSLTTSNKVKSKLRDCPIEEANRLVSILERYDALISLANHVRNPIIHREGFTAANLEDLGGPPVISINIGQEAVMKIETCLKFNSNFGNLFSWGVLGETNVWVETFSFSRALVALVCQLVSASLEALPQLPPQRPTVKDALETESDLNYFTYYHSWF